MAADLEQPAGVTADGWAANLEDFEVCGRLGFGWYGDVFLAKNRRRGDVQCVLKTVRLYPSNRKALKTEMSAFATLRSPHLVEVKRAFVQYGVLFVAHPLHVILEDVVGVLQPSTVLPSLLPVRLSTTMPLPVLCSLGGQLLHGLRFLHDEGLVHLDLKASNLLLAADGALKLADLGVSQLLPAADSPDFRRLAESQRFLAPEVAVGEPFDERADSWTLALCLLQLAFGVRPFDLAEAADGALTPLVFAVNEEASRPAARLTARLQHVPLDAIFRHGRLLEASMPPAMLDFVRACLVGRADRRPALRDLRRHEFVRGCVVDRELVVEALLSDQMRAKYAAHRALVVKRQEQQLERALPRVPWLSDVAADRFPPPGPAALLHVVAFEPQSAARREVHVPVDAQLKDRLLDDELRLRLFEWVDGRSFSLHNFFQLSGAVLRLFGEYKQQRGGLTASALTLHPDPAVRTGGLERLQGHELVFLVYVLDAQSADAAAEWLARAERLLVAARYCPPESLVDRAWRRLLALVKAVKPRVLAS